MIKECNILIAGVGGQGVILLSELIGKAAVSDGLKVCGSEILGMAVRGGSVVSTIRIGDDVYGPLIPDGKGNLMIGLEPAEALRNITYMSESSIILINVQRVVPVAVLLGKTNYPSTEEIIKKLQACVHRVVPLDALNLAREAGSTLSTNIAMLGASFGTGLFPIKIGSIKKIIKEHFPANSVTSNIKAFELGYQTAKKFVTKL